MKSNEMWIVEESYDFGVAVVCPTEEDAKEWVLRQLIRDWEDWGEDPERFPQERPTIEFVMDGDHRFTWRSVPFFELRPGKES